MKKTLTTILFISLIISPSIAMSTKSNLPKKDCDKTIKITQGKISSLGDVGSGFSFFIFKSRLGNIAAFYPTSKGYRYSISNDNGQTWSESIAFSDRADDISKGKSLDYNGLIKIGGSGTQIAGPNTVTTDIYRFTDDLKNYIKDTATIYLPNPSDEPTSPFMFFAPTFDQGKIINLPNGDMLTTMYGYFKGDVRTRVIIVKSTDNAKTWHYYSNVAYQVEDPNPELPGEYTGYTEPCITMLKDGRLLCMLRTQGSHFPPDFRPIYTSWSDDLGKTWTKPIPTNPHLINIWPTVITLDNGVVVCKYNRPGARLAFSIDKGKTWTNQMQLSDVQTGVQADTVQIGPNKLLVITPSGGTAKVYPLTVEIIDKPLPASIKLKGHILDMDGNPIQNAVVELGPNRFNTVYKPIKSKKEYPTTKTDTKGSFSFDNLPACEKTMTIEAEGFLPVTAHIGMTAYNQPLSFKLQPGSVISSSILDQNGSPIEGACVIFNEADHIHSDSTGQFYWQISNSAPDKAKVRIVKQGYVQQCQTMSLSQIKKPIKIYQLPYPDDGPEIACVKNTPSITAKFDDPDWNKSETTDNLWLKKSPNAKPIPVKAKFAYDKDNLYSIIKVGPSKDCKITNEDMIELYIAKQSNPVWQFQYAYNTAGPIGSEFGWNITQSAKYNTIRYPDGSWSISTAVYWPVLGCANPRNPSIPPVGTKFKLGLSHIQAIEGNGKASQSLPATFSYGILVLK